MIGAYSLTPYLPNRRPQMAMCKMLTELPFRPKSGILESPEAGILDGEQSTSVDSEQTVSIKFLSMF